MGAADRSDGSVYLQNKGSIFFLFVFVMIITSGRS